MTSLTVERVGSQTPTLLHLPADRHDASRADDLLEVADLAGFVLDEWQEMCLRESAWLRRPARRGARPKWSASDVLIGVTRQSGKGDVKIVRQLCGLFVWRERLQVHTAHEFKTTYEHFRRIVDVVDNVPAFTKLLHPRTGIRTGAGDQAIELRSGERIRFLARSGKSGRGLTGDTVYLDEAFALTPAMIGALQYALRARPNPQTWYTSSAPHANSDVLHGMHARAERTTEEEPRLLAAIWGNPQDVDPGDQDAWYRAGPALGTRVGIETMENEYRGALSSPDLMREFLREALGVPELAETVNALLPMETWRARGDVAAEAPPEVCAVDVSPDRGRAAVSRAGWFGERKLVEVTGADEGTAWCVAHVAELGVPCVVDPASPAGSLIGDLQRAGVTVVEISGRQYAQACGDWFDDVVEGRAVHVAQAVLDDALAAVRKKTTGDAFVWDRRRSSSDITPWVSATLAAWGLEHLPDGETYQGSGFSDLSEFVEA